MNDAFKTLWETWLSTSMRLSRSTFDFLTYQIDTMQRCVLFWDVMRKRANNMLAHMDAGMPPLLAYEHEMIIDGRKLERPVNYALVRIIPPPDADIDETFPPVVIFDPRAGHGPGIGGFKEDSEVGMAIKECHQPYFVIFFPDPCPGQTIEDIEKAEILFLEEVYNRHRKAGRPIVYGNCQAGWAVAMLGADRPDVTGPIVINGAPMSYWAGEAGKNPMRVSGSLMGGDWVARLMADLGGGRFDGAWLVYNFENLNPSNTLWKKNYNLYKGVDTEEKRFLEFERWWTGFYSLNKDEILWIVQNLFIGDLLEQSGLQIGPGHRIDMKNLRDPLVIFASSGDNITPPYEALDWISEIYPTTEDLKKNDQRIVYLINPHVGHLGIFVSAKVAQREHRAIIESFREIEDLRPGLYEMIIEGETGETDPRKKQLRVRFEEREIKDVQFPTDRETFGKVARVSKQSGEIYESTLGPIVRKLANPVLTEWLKWTHPERGRRVVFSDRIFPPLRFLGSVADGVRRDRRPAPGSNPYVRLERFNADLVAGWLDLYRDARDGTTEFLFRIIYG
jgi:hypothetical protein